MNLPNLITIARILLVPVVVWAIASHEMQVAFVLFLLAGVSDAVDGFLAKRFHMKSELGAYLDPLADKVLIVSIYVALGITEAIPRWIVILVVSRDILIVGGIMLAVFLGKPMKVKPVLVSKLNTAAQIVFACLVLAALAFGFTAETRRAGHHGHRRGADARLDRLLCPRMGGPHERRRARGMSMPAPERNRRDGPARAGPRQLAFELDPPENFSREDFLRGAGNAAALAAGRQLAQLAGADDRPGRAGGVRQEPSRRDLGGRRGRRRLASRALDEAAVPAALSTGALALERAGPCDAHDVDERAMFHLLNLAQEQRAFLLITARAAPAGWPIGLPDLASRLRALPVVTLAAPDDAMLRAVLVKLFADRQLAVDDGLISFLMVRIERSFAAARAVVAKLDREALRRQRPVTRALAGEILGSAAP